MVGNWTVDRQAMENAFESYVAKILKTFKACNVSACEKSFKAAMGRESVYPQISSSRVKWHNAKLAGELFH